VERGGFEPPKA